MPDCVKNASWEPGDILEVGCHDYTYAEQGKGILVVCGQGPRPGLYRGYMAGAQDDAYSWWLNESGEAANPGTYRLVTAVSDKDWREKKSEVSLVKEWRVLSSGGEMPDLGRIAWVRAGLRKVIADRIRDGLGQG